MIGGMKVTTPGGATMGQIFMAMNAMNEMIQAAKSEDFQKFFAELATKLPEIERREDAVQRAELDLEKRTKNQEDAFASKRREIADRLKAVEDAEDEIAQARVSIVDQGRAVDERQAAAQKALNDAAKEMGAARAIAAEAAAAKQAAKEAKAEADALKAEYEAKLEKLRNIV